MFSQFVEVCSEALELNEKLIKSDQLEFHENLKSNFTQLVHDLSQLMKMPVSKMPLSHDHAIIAFGCCYFTFGPVLHH